jgi:4-amino-4-deoxy-L-arabinose transferase-like glycosyltransferase
MAADRAGLLTVFLLTALIWGVNIVWLSQDTRPPVWDMALHQTYALNYLGKSPSAVETTKLWEKSGNYPPFVHLAIAVLYLFFHPGPHIAALVNAPATFLLLWAVYELAKDYGGIGAGRWACLLTALTPYLMWVSRETILDYWLSALFALALVALRKGRGFQSYSHSLILGGILALGLLTKWFFAGLILVPLACAFFEFRIWDSPERRIHFADALIIPGIVAGFWYFPNIPRLVRYFGENAAIGAREGEPPVFTFQSFLYYLRLLEGYQLFGLLFVILCFACVLIWRRERLRKWSLLILSIVGGWAFLTLLRTKDPRFTMPLLGPLAIISGTWIQSWGKTHLARGLQALLIALLCLQAYAANFGVSWLPERVVILKGYQGSLTWDWNLYLQDYFGIFGPPRREDWKQDVILARVVSDSERRKIHYPALALVPDLPYFNESNFTLYARIRRFPIRVRHLKSAAGGIHSFYGYNYVLMTEKDQGMSWTTGASSSLNKIIVDHPNIFRLVETYRLPSGDGARLYFIQPVSTR